MILFSNPWWFLSRWLIQPARATTITGTTTTFPSKTAHFYRIKVTLTP